MTLFRDRQDAGRQLGEALRDRRGRPRLLVLALPRGGVPVAKEVARALGAPLDVVVVRKLGAPWHSELAIGAIAAVADDRADERAGDRAGDAHPDDGAAAGLTTVLNEDLIDMLEVDEARLERVLAAETAELRRREAAYRGERAPLRVRDREVIVVDDGVATGATMLAAAQALRRAGAAHVTLAVPVAPVETVPRLRQAADEVVCLHALRNLQSVGQWYLDFSQTSDEEVRALLAIGA